MYQIAAELEFDMGGAQIGFPTRKTIGSRMINAPMLRNSMISKL